MYIHTYMMPYTYPKSGFSTAKPLEERARPPGLSTSPDRNGPAHEVLRQGAARLCLSGAQSEKRQRLVPENVRSWQT